MALAHRRLPAHLFDARRVAIASCLALVASTMTSGAVALAEETAGVEAARACVGSAPTARDAAALARSCDQDVEIVSERTEWETTYATPEGATRLDISSTAVRTTVNGSWEAIDTSVTSIGGELRVVAPAFEMTFSDGSGSEPLARIVKDGHELTFDAPFELTSPVVEGSRVTYPGVLEGVDLVVSVHEDGTGFSEVLRVESPEAAANPALAELSFPVATSEELAVSQAGGGFEAVDGSGERVFSSPVPLMWDSATATPNEVPGGAAARPSASSRIAASGDVAGDASSADRVAGPLDGDVVVAMPAQVEEGAVTIVPDTRMIDDPGTQWPVFIDPSVSGGLHERTLIRSGNPDIVAGYNWSGNAGLGLCDPGTDSACSKWNDVHRLIYEYNGLSTIGSMSGSDVISATFSVFGAHSFGCTPTGVEAHWVTGISAGTTWNNYGNNFSGLLQAQSVAHKPACSNARQIEFDVTRLLRGTADGGYSTAAIGLRASNEGSMAGGWKRYGGDATLSVTYNRAPAAPTGLVTVNPDTVCKAGADHPFIRSATPSLRAKVSDPDPGQTVRANFEIRRYSDHALVWSTSTGYAASGTTLGATVPSGKLADGTRYRWWASFTDNEGRSGPANATGCEFTVDTTRPATPPVVKAVEGQPPLYQKDTVSGAIGKTGRFAFETGGVSDVVSYKYSFGTDSLDTPIAAGPGAVVAFTPTRTGSHSLWVQSVDRAGNVSDVEHYRFSVTKTPSNGLWPMDEGAGTTAADLEAGNSLTLSGGVGWAAGPWSYLDPADRALVFDSADDGARTAGPVVTTNKSYSVMAFVKLDPAATGGAAAAVSQGGQFTTAFGLGHKKGSTCPTGDGSCWAFWTYGKDAPSPGWSTPVMSSVPVEANEWVHLTGVYDDVAGTITLYVCPAGGAPQAAASVPFTATWSAGGALEVGRAFSNGTAVDEWVGAVDHLRVYARVVSGEELRRNCSKAVGPESGV